MFPTKMYPPPTRVAPPPPDDDAGELRSQSGARWAARLGVLPREWEESFGSAVQWAQGGGGGGSGGVLLVKLLAKVIDRRSESL